LLRGAEMVIDEIIIDADIVLVFPQGYRFSVKVYILPKHGSIKKCFGNKPAVQVIEIMDGRRTNGLSYPPVGAVIAVGGNCDPLILHPDHPVQAVDDGNIQAFGDSPLVASQVIDGDRL
jgi:hypothetical protein